jgi:hypothetical protein
MIWTSIVSINEGEMDAVYENFSELAGRKPTTWAKFAKAHAAAFKH